MIVNTTTFGEIEVAEDKIIRFKEGIPGFKDEKEFFIVLNEDEDSPLHWLQSIKTADLTFVITNPFDIYKDYEFDMSESLVKKLEIEDKTDVVVYTIVVIPEDMTKMTTNLIGPIVINSSNMLAKQIIIEDERYSTKHYIIDQGSLEESKGGN